VATALVEIDRETLQAKIERGERLVIVDALPPLAYSGAHLPGAVNIPPERVDDLAAKRIPDTGIEVVVYCAGPACDSSVEVAERLVALGYTNVLHFSGGKQSWREAGLPLEGGRV
jgi:rhodanese-related sulfurtransferase